MTIAAAEHHDADRGEPVRWEFSDKAGIPYQFDGWFLSSVSTEMPRSRQWTEMEVYRKADDGAYVLRTIGCSVVYHVHNSVCNTGEPQRARDMDEDLEPCRRCQPPDYRSAAGRDRVFDVEVDITSLSVAHGAAELIRAMRTNRDGRQGGRQGDLSYPASRLLRLLRASEPDIAQEMSRPRRL